MKDKDLPKVSFVITTYNNKELVKRCLDSIFSQDYPKNKVEVITVDGGSKDGTLDLLKKYPVKIIHNFKRFPEGKGMGKSQGVDVAKGSIIAFVDQDNKLIGKGWLREMVFPLFNDKEIFGCACVLLVNKKDSLINRYLSMVGTDPFAIYRSLEGKLALKSIKLTDERDYYTYRIDVDNCLCTGGNCFLVRKKCLDLIGGYVQDVEMIYSLALMGINKLAIPKKPRVHHLTIDTFFNFLKKRARWGIHYAYANQKDRKYSWAPKNSKEYAVFIQFILSALLILPNVFIAIKRYNETKEKSWVLHPIAVFLVTLIYVYIGAISYFKKL